MNSDSTATSPEIYGHCSSVRDCVFKAISDPTRRYLLEQLKNSAMTVNQMADRLPITRPAVSQHLKALRDAQLVTVENRGTHRVYVFNDTGLLDLKAWIEKLIPRHRGKEPGSSI